MPSNDTGGVPACWTVTCDADAAVQVRVERDYESVTDATKTTTVEPVYCERHAEMWLSMDARDGIRRERIGALPAHAGGE